MEGFRIISPDKTDGNAISMIGHEWMLVSAEKDGKINMMTASWGGLGVMWNKPVAFVFIRPQRYTFGFTEAGDEFTLSFFDEEYRGMLREMGTKSGRDFDKPALSGLTYDLSSPHSPVPKEAKLVFRCRKLYSDFLAEECFCDRVIAKDNYPGGDYHRMYIAEITEALIKD